MTTTIPYTILITLIVGYLLGALVHGLPRTKTQPPQKSDREKGCAYARELIEEADDGLATAQSMREQTMGNAPFFAEFDKGVLDGCFVYAPDPAKTPAQPPEAQGMGSRKGWQERWAEDGAGQVMVDPTTPPR